MIPYSRQNIDEKDIEAVSEALKAALITTGPMVETFEHQICKRVGSQYGVAMNSGTAALHAAMFAINARCGDEVIVPAITFCSAANVVLFQNATPVFCDVDPDTLLIDLDKAERLITFNTKAIIAMDYAGQVCDYQRLKEISKKYGVYIISDACHSLGTIAPIADITAYSFHPLKHITTGEGGMAVTDNSIFAHRMRQFRFHGMDNGLMVELGYNYRLTDFQCALGMSQLEKLDYFIQERRKVAAIYTERLPKEWLLKVENEHTYHLFVIKIPDRDRVFYELRKLGIRVTVHYIPVYQHPYYRGYKHNCPAADRVSKEIMSIPIYPGLDSQSQEFIIKSLEGVI